MPYDTSEYITIRLDEIAAEVLWAIQDMGVDTKPFHPYIAFDGPNREAIRSAYTHGDCHPTCVARVLLWEMGYPNNGRSVGVK